MPRHRRGTRLSAGRGPPQPRFGGAGGCSILGLGKGFQFFERDPAVTVGFSAAERLAGDRCVLLRSLRAGMINPHDDQRPDLARGNQLVRCLRHSPVFSLDKRSRAFKQVLPVLQVQRGKAPLGLQVVSRRQIDDYVPLPPQNSRCKCRMLVQFADRSPRSFASHSYSGSFATSSPILVMKTVSCALSAMTTDRTILTLSACCALPSSLSK